MNKYGVWLLAILSGILLSGRDSLTVGDAPKVHEQALTVDTHCDTPMRMVRGFNVARRHDTSNGRVDFPRMKEGGLDAMFFAVFTGQRQRIPENYKRAYDLAHQMLDSIHVAVDKNSELAEIALTSGDAAHIEKTGKRAVYIGMENGFPVGMQLERVKEFYDRGVRYITLCHSFHNDICDSSTDSAEPEHNGLSGFGKEVVKEMNRLGMMVDVSHASDKTFFDVLEMSEAPVIASHSSVRAIAHNDRNMTDEMIRKLAENRGVIQICLLGAYVKDPDTTTVRYKEETRLYKIYREQYHTMTPAEKDQLSKEWDEMQKKYPEDLPTVKDLVDHIDHVVRLVGVDYVGIGSDFDGGGALANCQDVSQFPNITTELIRRGYSQEDINKIWGGNCFRVFKEVEKVAQKSNQ